MSCKERLSTLTRKSSADDEAEGELRSRERLIEVLRSVNPSVFGPGEGTAVYWALRGLGEGKEYAAQVMKPFGWGCTLRWIAECHSSPHIRELAGEALHYLALDTVTRLDDLIRREA